ncbi:MAG: LytTR family DNA-binding domain-containing protein [Pseudomonadota bacterium]
MTASFLFTRQLLMIGAALTVLFAVLSPDASAGLPLISRLLFWAAHIGIGLSIAVLCARRLALWFPALRDWRLIAAAGIAGVVVFAPCALLLEWLFPVLEAVDERGWLDQVAGTSTLAAVVVEGIELAPSYLAAWCLINAAPIAFTQRRENNDPKSTQAQAPLEDSSDPASSFLARLPPAIGRDLVSVSSDLHYLNVVTMRGRAMILGAMQDVETAFGKRGLRVHRSHWVHNDAVVRVWRTSPSWQIELADGSRVPVSRRKRAAVIAQLGQDFCRDK